VDPSFLGLVANTIVAQNLGTKYLLDAEALGRIRNILRDGGLVVYPTDTVYGLAADPFQPAAVGRVFEVKGRPRDQPISIALAGIADVFDFGEPTPIAQAFCEKNLPGPYTVILRARSQAPPAVLSKDRRIALRVPAHPIPRLLSKAYGPITATSANRHGSASPVTCADAQGQLGDGVDLYVDGGPTPLGGESTVVDLSGERAKILRPGVLPTGA